jgi:serine/threonine protein kinase/formylglycine-generating enzyme required for sulfatase activity
MAAEPARILQQHLHECNGCLAQVCADPDNHRPSAAFPFLAPPIEPDEIGRLGEYRVLRFLNRGGMGVVFHAEDAALKRSVALKVLKPDLDGGVGVAWQRLLREARMLAAIRHENVVTVFDAGQQGPVTYLAMELLEGQSLDDLLASGRSLPSAGIIRIAREIAGGLAAIHRQGLIHRDLKPSNIWLEAYVPELGARVAAPDALGHVKILDLGLARPIEDDAFLTETGIVVGTPAFMSPEQACNEPVGIRSDLFSLGCVLYALCTGHGPFLREDTREQLQAQAMSDPRPIHECNPTIPARLADLVMHLLAKNPEHRPASAADVVLRLQQLEAPREQPTPAPVPGITRTLRAHAAQARDSSRSARWRKRTAVVLGCLLVSLGALVAVCWAWPAPAPAQPAVVDANSLGHVAMTIPAPPVADSQQPTRSALRKRFTNSLGMEFVLVPRGRFWKGGGADRPSQREVAVADDFYLGVYEVTQQEWEQVMGPGNNPSQFSRAGSGRDQIQDVSDADLRRFPVDSVSWDDCQEFLALLNMHVKETGWVYRLPREIEWEYACRGGPMSAMDDSAFDFYLGAATNVLPPDGANFADSGLQRTRKVGSYPPNRLGLYDMHGNVFELCDDRLTDDNGAALRPLRGGGWLDPSDFCAARCCNVGAPSGRYNGSGFRIARVPSEK